MSVIVVGVLPEGMTVDSLPFEPPCRSPDGLWEVEKGTIRPSTSTRRRSSIDYFVRMRPTMSDAGTVVVWAGTSKQLSGVAEILVQTGRYAEALRAAEVFENVKTGRRSLAWDAMVGLYHQAVYTHKFQVVRVLDRGVA